MADNTNFLSISDLQRITGADRATIGKRVKGLQWQEGKQGAKLYNPVEAIPLILDKKSATKDEAVDRKAIADAEKAELLVARLRGELVPVADMKQAAAELLKVLHQTIVRIQPAIIASTIVGLTDPIEIEVRIREPLAKIFDELRSMPENFLSVDVADLPEETEDEE